MSSSHCRVASYSANGQTIVGRIPSGSAALNLFSMLNSITTCSSVAKRSEISEIWGGSAIPRLIRASHGEQKIFLSCRIRRTLGSHQVVLGRRHSSDFFLWLYIRIVRFGVFYCSLINCTQTSTFRWSACASLRTCPQLLYVWWARLTSYVFHLFVRVLLARPIFGHRHGGWRLILMTLIGENTSVGLDGPLQWLPTFLCITVTWVSKPQFLSFIQPDEGFS